MLPSHSCCYTFFYLGPSTVPMKSTPSCIDDTTSKKKKKETQKLGNYRLSLGFPVGIQLGAYSIFDEKFTKEYVSLTSSCFKS